jgi:5-methylthioadenosine/S-adenosylhomocysteine deaminase
MSSPTAFEPSSDGPQACHLLIRNATVWTVDPEHRSYSPGAIAISGNRIVDVGPDHQITSRYASDTTLDAGGGIAHPGFIEAHTHISMHLTREAFPDALNSSGYFSSLIRSLNELTPEDEYASALLATAEMLRSGITTFADSGTVMDTEAASQAIELAGIRGLLADPFVWDIEDHEWTSGMLRFSCDETSAIGRLGGQLWRNRSEGLVRGYIALWGLATASDRLLLEAKVRADDAGVAVTQHQSLEPRDVARDRSRVACSPLTHFESIGYLGPNVSLSHMNYLSAEDKDALEGTGTSVVWVPGNFLYYSLLRHTRSPIPDMVSREINVALGTDVAKAWGYGEQGLLGYLAVRADGEFLSAESLLDMATIGGARSVMMSDQVGSIEPGKLADIVVRDPMSPELHPGINLVRNVMLGLRSKGVQAVVVNGEVVVKDGRIMKFDEEEAFRIGRERAQALAERIGVM